MSVERVWEKLGESGVVPVIAIDRETDALPLADALLAGGLPVVEITFRTAAAAGAIRTITMERPQLLVGAGTVLTLDNLEAAKANGAQFAVAPGCNPRVVNRARELGIPFIPGIATPTDIESALETGCRLLKFFPAEALGARRCWMRCPPLINTRAFDLCPQAA
jgi:2-dehydro-3-deoxyphosphogluconate aldolase/(4S)-4-hydroxy-2-oxoglutarate aldolase